MAEGGESSSEGASSLEYATLLCLTESVVTGISMDLLSVVTKLVARSLIPVSSLNPSPAPEVVVGQLLKAVKLDPNNFQKLLDVIDECPHMNTLATSIREKYEEKLTKSVSSAIKKSERAGLDSEIESDQKQESKFPHLNVKNLTEEERERLIRRLKLESDQMKNEFAILVDKTRASLERQNLSCKDLKVLTIHSNRNDIMDLLEEENKEIATLFCELSNYWSFFDYDFLSIIIKSRCDELIPNLNDYVTSFKKFCRRRFCEVPVDILKTTKKHKNIVHMKWDKHNYDTMTMEEIKNLELKLSELLNTELYLLRVQDGCVELVFNSLRDLDEIFPLSDQQKKQLYKMGIIQFSYGNHSYQFSLDCGATASDSKSDRSEDWMPTDCLSTKQMAEGERTSLEHEDLDQDPLKYTDIPCLRQPAPSCELDEFVKQSHGKWIFFRNFEDLKETWCVVREEAKSGRLGGTGALCGTLRYNPLRHGAGPVTTQRISVYTKEDNYIEVGMRLIKLKSVQHDIRYKTQKDTREGKFAHKSEVNQPVTCMTIFWNDGDPYHSVKPQPETTLCPAPCRNRYEYDPETDVWKTNIVEGNVHKPFHGKWILESNYDPASDINVTAMWHELKAKIEAEELSAIKMECPAPKYRKAPPEIHISTAQVHMDQVGKIIASMVRHDIHYIIGGGSFADDKKTLYWNRGTPSYEDAQQTRPGIAGDWRV